MAFTLYSASVRGSGHITRNQPNQDSVLTRNNRQSWLAVVSDGMGSRCHADIGSKAACRAVLRATRQCSFDIPDRDFIQHLYQNWLAFLGTIDPEDAVATCLVAWGLKSGKCRLFQLGDGVISYNSKSKGVLRGCHDNDFGNETTGLGLSRKFRDWSCKTVKLTAAGQGIILMTDGISDDIEQLDDFTPAVLSSLRGKGFRYGKRWMTRELENWPTPSHTDDKTIAVINRI